MYGPHFVIGNRETVMHKTRLHPQGRDLKEIQLLKAKENDTYIGAQNRNDFLTMAVTMITSRKDFSISKIRHEHFQGRGFEGSTFCFSTKDKP